MGKTRKYKYTSCLLHNGERGHHNTLLREFKGTNCGLVKDVRGLLDRRDYKSDRNKGYRKVENHRRRAIMKRLAREIIEENIKESS